MWEELSFCSYTPWNNLISSIFLRFGRKFFRRKRIGVKRLVKALRYLEYWLTHVDGLNWPGIFHKAPEEIDMTSYFQ
jgi:hypothetical protein